MALRPAAGRSRGPARPVPRPGPRSARVPAQHRGSPRAVWRRGSPRRSRRRPANRATRGPCPGWPRPAPGTSRLRPPTAGPAAAVRTRSSHRWWSGRIRARRRRSPPRPRPRGCGCRVGVRARLGGARRCGGGPGCGGLRYLGTRPGGRLAFLGEARERVEDTRAAPAAHVALGDPQVGGGYHQGQRAFWTDCEHAGTSLSGAVRKFRPSRRGRQSGRHQSTGHKRLSRPALRAPGSRPAPPRRQAAAGPRRRA